MTRPSIVYSVRLDLLSRGARVQGWSSGTPTDSTDAMGFAAKHGVRPMIETWPLAEASKAVAPMMDGNDRLPEITP